MSSGSIGTILSMPISVSSALLIEVSVRFLSNDSPYLSAMRVSPTTPWQIPAITFD